VAEQTVVTGKSVYNKVILGGIIAAVGIYVLLTKPENAALGWILVLVGGAIALTAWRSVPDPKLLMRYHNNPVKVVRELIEAWQPTPARLESDYERSLHSFLKSKLFFTKITRQYGSARVKCDLAVGNDVFIELKNGLRTTNRLQRLIGQIELYHNEWQGKPVLIVLLGESQEDLLHDLNRAISKYESVRVITKTGFAIAEAEDEQPKQAKAGESR
jgi:hypothetical protein